MNYEQFKAEVSKIELTKDLVKCGYISYLDEDNGLKKLNPFFGYSVGDYCGVHSMNWYTLGGGRFVFALTICNRSYKDVRLYGEDLTDEQRDKVAAYVKDWYAKKSAELAAYIEKGRNEISIEELQSECVRVANELLNGKVTRYGNKLHAELRVGKRGCDDKSEPYTALCVECYRNGYWEYLGGVRFYKDKFGVNQMKEFRPLCGESSGEFNWEWFKRNMLSYAA